MAGTEGYSSLPGRLARELQLSAFSVTVPPVPAEFGKGEGTCTWKQLLLKISEVIVYGRDI